MHFPASGLLSLASLALTFLVSASALPLQRRGGAIPALDGAAVRMAGGTYPRATRLRDGLLLGTFSETTGGTTSIRTVTSTDNGLSWSPLGLVTDAPTDTSDLTNPYPLQLPNGKLLVAFRNHSKDPATKAYTQFRITVCSSEDGGATWQYLSEPASDPGPVNGNWEPFLRNANDGSVQIYYSRENSGPDQDSLMRISDDGGASWSSATVISGRDVEARDGMIGIASTGGDNLIAIFECNQGGTFALSSVLSTDDGRTWGNRRHVYTATGAGNNAGSPQVINVGGTLVASFMTDEDTGAHRWFDGASTKILTSGDGGQTWGFKMEVGPVQSNWPGLVTLDDSSFLVLFDNAGSKAQKVTLF